MGYKAIDAHKKVGAASYRVIQVTIRGKSVAAANDVAVPITVANDLETLGFVKESMDTIVGNLVRVRQMDAQSMKQVEESAQLFEKNLEPLFTLISATSQEHVMDKLSVSLKKALLLMAMDRYSCDSERICRALGITQGKLEKELKRCGLSQQPSKAA